MDVLKILKRFQSVGFSQEQFEVFLALVSEMINERTVTKTELQELKAITNSKQSFFEKYDSKDQTLSVFSLIGISLMMLVGLFCLSALLAWFIFK